MKQYLDLLREVHEKGNARPDRTGTGTVSVFGRQMRFDLQKGFPILTTKRVPMKSVIGELLWFLSGSTNIKNLHKDGITIWDEWRAPWTKDRKLVRVPKKSPKYVPYEGNFSLMGVLSDKDSVDRKLANIWVKMMRRCYNPSAHNYRSYGAKGTSVCLRWHDPVNFINDAKLLPHWWYKETFWDEFELDKDYYGANQYGPETCVWLHHKENVPTTWVYVKDPEGREEYYCGYSEAAEKTGFSRSSLHRFVTQGLPEILKGKNRSAEGWEFKVCSEQDMLVRRELIPDGELGPIYGGQWRSWKSPTGPVDQIKELIDGIRNQPFSRRHIVTSWAVHDLGKMALPPCHCLFQFYVEDGRLSCQLYQRSADLFLGVPFNIASYALLTHMVAQQCDLEVGEFIHTFGDCHLYQNHRTKDIVEEQLKREPYASPQLVIKRKPPTIFDYQIDDFELVNYFPLPPIKAPISV